MLALKVPTVAFLQDEFVDEVQAAAGHPLASVRGVTNMSAEFAHAQLWHCVYSRCLNTTLIAS